MNATAAITVLLIALTGCPLISYGESEYYYREFSLKKAYPMGINIVVYALTQ